MKVTKYVIIEVEKTKTGDTVKLSLEAPTWRLTSSPVTTRFYGDKLCPVTCNGKAAVEVHADELDDAGEPVERIKVYLDPGQPLFRVEVREER